jgi:hypothetical protein
VLTAWENWSKAARASAGRVMSATVAWSAVSFCAIEPASCWALAIEAGGSAAMAARAV